MNYWNRKNALIFIGGMAFSAITAQVCKSKCAKNIAVCTLAKGLRVKDDFEHTIATIKEEAEDAYSEAKQKNEDKCCCNTGACEE